jgi:hypothetical protein
MRDLVLSLIAQKEAIKTLFLQESGCGEALEERERKKTTVDAGMRAQTGAGAGQILNSKNMPGW